MTVPGPFNQEAEYGVLGATLLYPSVARRLILDEALEHTHFFIPDCAKTWQAVLDLHRHDKPVDAVTVKQQLPGLDVDAFLIAASPASSVVEHAQIVKRCHLRRSWKTAAYQLLEASETDDEALVATAERQLHSPTVSTDTHTPEAIGDEVFQWLSNTAPVGVSTGLPKLDAFLGGGLRPGDTTAIGGWTGMGKSVLADQILTDAATQGARCHAYINEMSVPDRALRMIARQTRIPYALLVTRQLNDQQAKQATEACADLPFGITECAQWPAESIARHIRANAWDLCVLDLLHNIPYKDVPELDRIVATLAAAARSSGTHLLLVCQFNEERAKTQLLPQPVIRDIRGSGMVKNVCASVLLVHRRQEANQELVFTTNDGVVYAAKARHGQPGGDNVQFVPDRMRFYPTGGGLREVAA